jgi:hypothetical protein
VNSLGLTSFGVKAIVCGHIWGPGRSRLGADSGPTWPKPIAVQGPCLLLIPPQKTVGRGHFFERERPAVWHRQHMPNELAVGGGPLTGPLRGPLRGPSRGPLRRPLWRLCAQLCAWLCAQVMCTVMHNVMCTPGSLHFQDSGWRRFLCGFV